MKKHYNLIFIIITLYAGAAVAASLGELSNNLMSPVSGLAKIIHTISYITGGAFIVGSVMQYKQHRENPQQVRLSKPLSWLFLGIILISIPFLTKMFSQSAQLVVGSLYQ